MKKALSLFLAILMIFSVLSVGSYAVDADEETEVVVPVFPDTTSLYFSNNGSRVATMEQVVINFNLNGGTLMYTENLFTLDNEGKVKRVSQLEANSKLGSYVAIPVNAVGQADESIMKPGMYANTPMVEAPKGYTFVGWDIYYLDNSNNSQTSSCMAGNSWMIPRDAKSAQVINAIAVMRSTGVEQDSMSKIMGILVKLFGAIVGIIMYGGDVEAGKKVVEKLFTSILG